MDLTRSLATCGMFVLASATQLSAQSPGCDTVCLEEIGDQYRAAYLARDPKQAPISDSVRYTENNVEMPFPEGTWDTVTAEGGPALTLSDPVLGSVAIFTPIKQREIEGYLAVRLKVENRQITEIEHIVSTKRTLSGPTTPIEDHAKYVLDPIIAQVTPPNERVSRDKLIAHAHGYFDTLQKNDGQIKGTCFHDYAIRRENGRLFTDIGPAFGAGRYAFNDRVRREIVLVDEARQIAMARGFIDHKGVLDEYKLTDGTNRRSGFREPQTWAFLEMFKVKDGCIASVVATFYQSSYFQRSPWTVGPDRTSAQ